MNVTQEAASCTDTAAINDQRAYVVTTNRRNEREFLASAYVLGCAFIVTWLTLGAVECGLISHLSAGGREMTYEIPTPVCLTHYFSQ
jgi:hypothetical protein